MKNTRNTLWSQLVWIIPVKFGSRMHYWDSFSQLNLFFSVKCNYIDPTAEKLWGWYHGIISVALMCSRQLKESKIA